MKTCTKCGEVKPLEDFYKVSRANGGDRGVRKPECKACQKAREAERYANTREARLAKQAEYRANNSEAIRAKKAEYRANNSEAIRAKKAEWYANNHEAIRAKNAEYYVNNRKAVKARKAKYSRRIDRKVDKMIRDAMLRDIKHGYPPSNFTDAIRASIAYELVYGPYAKEFARGIKAWGKHPYSPTLSRIGNGPYIVDGVPTFRVEPNWINARRGKQNLTAAEVQANWPGVKDIANMRDDVMVVREDVIIVEDTVEIIGETVC